MARKTFSTAVRIDEVLHAWWQKLRLIDLPGAKMLAHKAGINHARAKFNSDYSDRLLGLSLHGALVSSCSEAPDRRCTINLCTAVVSLASITWTQYL